MNADTVQEKGGTVGPQWTLVENGQRSVAHVTEQTTSQVDVTNPSCAAATFGSALVLSENEEPKVCYLFEVKETRT